MGEVKKPLRVCRDGNVRNTDTCRTVNTNDVSEQMGRLPPPRDGTRPVPRALHDRPCDRLVRPRENEKRDTGVGKEQINEKKGRSRLHLSMFNEDLLLSEKSSLKPNIPSRRAKHQPTGITPRETLTLPFSPADNPVRPAQQMSSPSKMTQVPTPLYPSAR